MIQKYSKQNYDEMEVGVPVIELFQPPALQCFSKPLRETMDGY